MRESPAEGRIPRWLWRALLLALGLTAVGGALAAMLLLGGAADPAPAGPLRWEQHAEPPGCLDLGAIPLPTLSPPVTVELAAERLESASEFAAWGLWLERPEGPRWEVLPSGYYQHAGQTIPFHHVQSGQNTLRLDVADGRHVLWLNRELAGEGPAPDGPLPWGLVGDAAICWRRLALYGQN